MENKLNKRERYKAQLKPIDYYKDFEKEFLHFFPDLIKMSVGFIESPKE